MQRAKAKPRHCERKRSNPASRKYVDCFVAAAPRNDGLAGVQPSASSHSAAPRQSVSRCSGRKKPKWPIAFAPTSTGVMVMISGVVDLKAEHKSSTAGRVAKGSSEKHIARSSPLYFTKFEMASRSG